MVFLFILLASFLAPSYFWLVLGKGKEEYSFRLRLTVVSGAITLFSIKNVDVELDGSQNSDT